MTADVKSLEDLKTLTEDAVVAAPTAPVVEETKAPRVVVKDKLGRSYATGKRKRAVARVWIKQGKGTFSVNGRELPEYFARPALQALIDQPFSTAAREKMFDVTATVKGGGLSSQAGAIRHGISKAMTLFEPELRDILKKAGFLTRDARVVERKKYGKKKARRSPQFSKR